MTVALIDKGEKVEIAQNNVLSEGLNIFWLDCHAETQNLAALCCDFRVAGFWFFERSKNTGMSFASPYYLSSSFSRSNNVFNLVNLLNLRYDKNLS